MRIAITGGTGFVGRHLARRLLLEGHSVILIARGVDQRDREVLKLGRSIFTSASVTDTDALARAFAGCDAIAHCAGINRELGSQTYDRIHLEGTKAVVEAARRTSVQKIVLLSFLRARPNCGSPYHESKWAAEEIVRSSALDFTIVKAGVIYGKGDHLLDHLSRALRTVSLFALVGLRPKPLRPVAVEEVVSVLRAAVLRDQRLSRKTVAVLGPEQLQLSEAVRRIGTVIGRRPILVRAPVLLHQAFAWILERLMQTPLVSVAQVRIFSEGVVEPPFPLDELPEDLRPAIRFEESQIRRGLPEPGGFRWSDLRCFAQRGG